MDSGIEDILGDGWDDELGLEPREQFGSRRDDDEVTLSRENCEIQVNPGDDLKKEKGTNIIVKSSKKVSDVSTSSSRQQLNLECQDKQDVSINIAITPGSSNPIVDIKLNTEIKIRKRKSSEEPVVERKRKREKGKASGERSSKRFHW